MTPTPRTRSSDVAGVHACACVCVCVCVCSWCEGGREPRLFSLAESAPRHTFPTASAAPTDDATPFLEPAPVSPGPTRLSARSLTEPFGAAVPMQRGVSPPASAAKPAPAAPPHAAPATPPQAAAPTMPPPPAAPPSPAAVQLPPIMLAPAATLSPLLAPTLPTGVSVGGGDAQLPASTLTAGAAVPSLSPAAQLLPPVVPRLPPHTVSLRILVAGPPGAGKSSLVAALASGGVEVPLDGRDSRGGGRCTHSRRSFAAGGGTLVATFAEADVVTKEDAHVVADCLLARAAALDTERAPCRRPAAPGDADPRFDAALILLPPHAPVTHAARTLVGALTDASVSVILPVLTAADAYTEGELSCSRAASRAALPDLPALPFSDSVLDAAASPRAAPPFASVCSDRGGCGRAAGVCPPSDVASLRALLLGPGVADVKAATDASYEAWRSEALRGGWDRGTRARRARAALARAPWRTLAAVTAAALAGYAAIAFAVGGRARLADDAAALRRAVVGRAQRAERVAAAGAAAAATQAARAAGSVEAAAAAVRERAADVAGSAADVAHPQPVAEKRAPRFWLW